MLEMDKKCNALSNTGFVTKRMSGSGKKRCWPLYVSWSVWIWVWFGTEFELFHCFLLKVESQWRWLSFETWTKIFVLSYNSQPANQKRFASGRRIAHNIKKSRSFSCGTNKNNTICHVTSSTESLATLLFSVNSTQPDQLTAQLKNRTLTFLPGNSGNSSNWMEFCIAEL